MGAGDLGTHSLRYLTVRGRQEELDRCGFYEGKVSIVNEQNGKHIHDRQLRMIHDLVQTHRSQLIPTILYHVITIKYNS